MFGEKKAKMIADDKIEIPAEIVVKVDERPCIARIVQGEGVVWRKAIWHGTSAIMGTTAVEFEDGTTQILPSMDYIRFLDSEKRFADVFDGVNLD